MIPDPQHFALSAIAQLFRDSGFLTLNHTAPIPSAQSENTAASLSTCGLRFSGRALAHFVNASDKESDTAISARELHKTIYGLRNFGGAKATNQSSFIPTCIETIRTPA